MQKKFGQHIILLIYSSILELKFPAPYLNFWAWHCLFDLVGVALKTMEISSQTQQLHCTAHCSPKMNTVFPRIVSALEQFPHFYVLLPKVTVHKNKFKKEQFPRKLFAEIRYSFSADISPFHVMIYNSKTCFRILNIDLDSKLKLELNLGGQKLRT